MAVSDDLAWVRQRLGGRRSLVVAGRAGDGPGPLDPVGRDLALLAACSHTVISQGLFGTWGAYLAGGDVYSTYGVMVRDVLS
jgi:galactoside 2-L-fucosyltransferase 1/2